MLCFFIQMWLSKISGFMLFPEFVRLRERGLRVHIARRIDVAHGRSQFGQTIMYRKIYLKRSDRRRMDHVLHRKIYFRSWSLVPKFGNISKEKSSISYCGHFTLHACFIMNLSIAMPSPRVYIFERHNCTAFIPFSTQVKIYFLSEKSVSSIPGSPLYHL